MAYDRAVEAADADDRKRAYSQETKGKAAFAARQVAEPDPPTAATGLQPLPRTATKPSVALGMPITEYSDRTLIDLIRWIESDTLLRTEDELFDQFVLALGFKRRGSRIGAAFNRVLPLARRESRLP